MIAHQQTTLKTEVSSSSSGWLAAAASQRNEQCGGGSGTLGRQTRQSSSSSSNIVMCGESGLMRIITYASESHLHFFATDGFYILRQKRCGLR